ncbi:MerR family transcriptional regulator [Streptosporangium sp. NPDC023615]|uniref:MerR family transcriptional regulator n=1 Tax=Streptosporangium sp. NPDC023615 TaxID=3154794 RepID=UPI0034317D1C
MNEGHLPIGRFARLCRLSVKQLRHYDELGLLTPDRIDPDTGYRYYLPGQARAAMLIGLLRSLDVPLASIGRVLDGESGVLDGVRDRMRDDLARRERNVVALQRILSDGLPRPEVTVVREPARRVVLVRDVASPERIGAVTSACMARLMAAVGTPEGLLAGLFPLDLTGEVPVTVAAETSRDVPGTSEDVLPGGPFASATHVGPYDQISLTAHALLAWIGERGHTPRGPLREVYVSDPATTPPDRLVTHLMIGLEDEG